ncbi:MAG: hypothetical protein EOM05_07900 [Clostridia bacterium]|nr:hypothetical protein [Clostridia bacterium]
MEDLIKADNDIKILEPEQVEVVYGKVLELREDKLSVDFKGVLNQVFQCVNLADIADKIHKATEYVVQIPTEFQQAFDKGEVFIMENSKTGKEWATLMKIGENGKNKIVTPLSIKSRDYIAGNPAKDIANNYHNMYMQQQMNELAGLIETTLDTVKRIEYGQMDDRIGLLNAGKQSVMLALSQKDETTRMLEISQGRQNITTAQNQIAETFKRRVSEFKSLPKSTAMQYIREFTQSGYLNSKDDEYDQIKEYFDLYLKSTNLLAATYSIVGDTDNAQRVYDLGIEKIQNIDFTTLKTIEYAHKNSEFEKIYENTTGFIETEKQFCIENTKEYDCISVTISGEKLLEVISNGESLSE